MSESMTQLLARLEAFTERAESAEAELLAVREDNHSMMMEIDGLRTERDALAAELAKLREQEPVAYLDYWKSDGSGVVRKQQTTGLKFYAAPIPALAVPDWNVNIERIRDVMHMLGISIEESVECFSAALPTNINRMTLAMKRHLQELAGMTAITPTPFIPDDDTRRNDEAFAAQQAAPSVPEEWQEVMAGLVGIAEAKGKKHGSPNHSHSRPGIWDDDNIRNGLAGKPCAECEMYDRARALLQSAEVKS